MNGFEDGKRRRLDGIHMESLVAVTSELAGADGCDVANVGRRCGQCGPPYPVIWDGTHRCSSRYTQRPRKQGETTRKFVESSDEEVGRFGGWERLASS